MQIGVLGTGMVGETIATALVGKGHQVMMGSRSKDNEKAAAWAQQSGEAAQTGSFADAAGFGELLFICVNGEHALKAVGAVGADTVAGKIIIDVTNPLDFSGGMPPAILPQFREVGLGAQIQQVLPGAYVVKTLNTVNCRLMVAPQQVGGGQHHIFMCGNHADAKAAVKDFLSSQFNWQQETVVDLGGIEASRTAEGIVPFWVMVLQAIGTPMFNFQIVR